MGVEKSGVNFVRYIENLSKIYHIAARYIGGLLLEKFDRNNIVNQRWDRRLYITLIVTIIACEYQFIAVALRV